MAIKLHAGAYPGEFPRNRHMAFHNDINFLGIEPEFLIADNVAVLSFNSFGPNISQQYIIPEIISQILSEKNVITLGNLQSKRDLTFVSDTARAILLSLTCEDVIGETINVGSQRALSIRELVKVISNLLSKDVEVEVDPSRFRPFDVDNLVVFLLVLVVLLYS